MNTDIALHTLAGPDDRTARLLALVNDPPPVCAYDPKCRCVTETRHMFGYAHVGQNRDYTYLLLNRAGVADVMVDLFANPTVNRMWIEVDHRSTFMWFSADSQTRIGDWVVDYEGHSYCFQWTDDREEVHCNTLGEWWGPIDCFGQRRWSSHRAAVMWTLDNIDRIATRQNA